MSTSGRSLQFIYLGADKPATGNISFQSICPGLKPVFPCWAISTRWKQCWLLSLRLLLADLMIALSSETLSFQNTLAQSSCLLAPCPTQICGSISGLSLSPRLLLLPEVTKWQPDGLVRPTSGFCLVLTVFCCCCCNLNATRWGKHSASSPQSPSLPTVLHPSASRISITCLVPEAI